MNFNLARYYLIELFSKFKYVFAAVIIISTVIITFQYSHAREFGNTYTHLSRQFEGPFSIEKDKKMEQLIDEHARLSSIAYDDLQNSWLERFINQSNNNSEGKVESELWDESQKFLNGKGRYGNTIYEDILILSTLIESYRNLSQVEDNKAQMQEYIARNVERPSSDTEYWSLLMKKSKQLQKVEFYDMRAIHSFLQSYATDWMFLFALIIVLSTIFCSDYEQNRHLLLFSMPISHVRVGIHKISCSLFVSLMFSIVSTIINLSLLASHTTNFQSFMQPIQAIGSMSNSLLNMTVFEYILLLIINKTIFYVFIAVIVTFISLISKRLVYSLIASISLVALSVLISKLMQIISPFNILSQYNLLNFYSHDNFLAMDDYTVVFSNLIHNTTILFTCVVLLFLLISTIIISFNQRISRGVV